MCHARGSGPDRGSNATKNYARSSGAVTGNIDPDAMGSEAGSAVGVGPKRLCAVVENLGLRKMMGDNAVPAG